MAQKYSAAQYGVLRAPPGNPLSPHPKRGGFHMPAHQVNDSGLIQAKLGFNRLKCRTVFPSHFDNARDAGIAQSQSIEA
jgi:hypothetical protein